MNWARTIAFSIVFYGLSIPIVLTTPITALFGWKALAAHTRLWTRLHGWTTTHILGIRRRIEGDPFAGGPVLYAAKHQAMYETVELGGMLRSPGIHGRNISTRVRPIISIQIWASAFSEVENGFTWYQNV